jgi:hypothetical protein
VLDVNKIMIALSLSLLLSLSFSLSLSLSLETELYANAGGYHQILPMDTLHVMGSEGIASLLKKLGNMSVARL